jgi:hypothetical protein
MAGKRSNIVCPICHSTGSLHKRWVKTTVNIPKAEKVTNISKAWDYASKVCLRMRELTILYPRPTDIEQGMIRFVHHIFNFVPFTNDELVTFEQKHLSTPAKNIRIKKAELTS